MSTMYIKKLNSSFGNKFELIGEFIGMNKKTLHRCTKDNFIFEIKPSSLLKTGYCKECNRIKRRDMFLEKLRRKHPDIELLGEYKTMNVSVKFVCAKHKEYGGFKRVPSSILKSKEPCPICRKLNKLIDKDKSTISNKIKDIVRKTIKEETIDTNDNKPIKEVSKETVLNRYINKVKSIFNRRLIEE